MNYVKNLNICGTDIKEIPCIKGNGGPGSYIGGAVGLLYMDVDSGEIYKCTRFKEGVSTWVKIPSQDDIGDIETALDNIITDQESIIAIQNSLIGGDS